VKAFVSMEITLVLPFVRVSFCLPNRFGHFDSSAMKSIRSLFAATLALLAPALHAATVQFAGVITDNAGS